MLANKEELLTLRRVADEGADEYKVLMLHRSFLSFKVIKVCGHPPQVIPRFLRGGGGCGARGSRAVLGTHARVPVRGSVSRQRHRRETSISCLSHTPQLGIEPRQTQACALSRDQSLDPLVYGMTLPPAKPHGQRQGFFFSYSFRPRG